MVLGKNLVLVVEKISRLGGFLSSGLGMVHFGWGDVMCQ
jgi:hypothetical protein